MFPCVQCGDLKERKVPSLDEKAEIICAVMSGQKECDVAAAHDIPASRHSMLQGKDDIVRTTLSGNLNKKSLKEASWGCRHCWQGLHRRGLPTSLLLNVFLCFFLFHTIFSVAFAAIFFLSYFWCVGTSQMWCRGSSSDAARTQYIENKGPKNAASDLAKFPILRNNLWLHSTLLNWVLTYINFRCTISMTNSNKTAYPQVQENHPRNIHAN